MIRSINAMGWLGQFIGTALLVWLFLVTALFVTRYVSSLPWYVTEEGKHLTAMTTNIWAFSAVYLMNLFWPDMPEKLRQYLLLGLLVFFVGNCTWRWIMLERFLAKRRRRAAEAGRSKTYDVVTDVNE